MSLTINAASYLSTGYHIKMKWLRLRTYLEAIFSEFSIHDTSITNVHTVIIRDRPYISRDSRYLFWSKILFP